jgi:asparagine synthetase B (glutamine-hydrolysing)
MDSKPDGKHKKMEKYILRKAFDVEDDPYLPEEVLWRQKEQFSDGVGYDWVDGLKDYADMVSSPLPPPPSPQPTLISCCHCCACPDVEQKSQSFVDWVLASW